MKIRSAVLLAGIATLPVQFIPGQSTQGLITGRVFDEKTGRAVAGATIKCIHQQTGETSSTTSASDGYYTLQRLASGLYSLRATKEGPEDPVLPGDYQPRETYELELFVAGRMQIDIPMRQKADTYSQSVYAESYLPNSGAIVHTYSSDLTTTRAQYLSVLSGSAGTLASTLSFVIDPQQVQNLPLSGRDIYTMLVTLPGVTADNATARGLGLSVNGQRSSSSNFLLDGVENNDYLLTGPRTVIAPEAAQEYRVSTNNYSAEYGRTGGFVANAITRSGSNLFHGTVYTYLTDTSLNANSYQHVAGLNSATGERGSVSLPRQPQTDIYAGFQAGGPIVRNRLFWSAAWERFRSRGSADLFPFQVPVLSTFEACFPTHYSTSLLSQYRPPIPVGFTATPGDCTTLSTTYNARPPLQFNRQTALARVDRTVSDTQRYFGRLAISRFSQPYFVYSIYPGFSSELDRNSTGLALGHLWLPTPGTDNELRFGFSAASQGWERPHPEVPILNIATGRDGPNVYPLGISLPGGAGDPQYDFHYGVKAGELSDVFSFAKGRQVIAAGAGLLITRSESLLTFRRDGLYQFNSLGDFALDHPLELLISVARQGPQALPALGITPDYMRTYCNNQFYGFLQDNIKLPRGVGINLGVRYESFGAPLYTGAQDGYFQPGPGATIDQRLAAGVMVYDPGHQRSPYRPDRNNWAARVGVSYDLTGRGRTVLRAAYGIFFDRPFENLTQSTRNNNMEQITLLPPPGYPQVSRAPATGGIALPNHIPNLLWIDANLRTPYVQSWFGGMQHQFSRTLYLEVTAQGALGRKLIASDVVNRRAANAFDSTTGRLNQNIAEDITFLSNAASSSYNALTAFARYRSQRGYTQVAWTWSHSIDNQSDPLQGAFDDLSFTRSTNNPNNPSDNRAGFTRQFQSAADRANSDFDQRQNLILSTVWDVGLPMKKRLAELVLDHWQAAGLLGFRSGFPFSSLTTNLLPACPGVPDSATAILRNRASLLPGRSAFLPHPVPVPGGFQLLDPSSFCDPGINAVGNLGRNALTGPGFWNVDLSLSKSFRPAFLGESGAVQFRADFFNAFNHANLGNPDGVAAICDTCTFGQALLGRQGVQPSFPSVTPLDQLARTVQFQIKLLF
jgi:hypothetical protein